VFPGTKDGILNTIEVNHTAIEGDALLPRSEVDSVCSRRSRISPPVAESQYASQSLGYNCISSDDSRISGGVASVPAWSALTTRTNRAWISRNADGDAHGKHVTAGSDGFWLWLWHDLWREHLGISSPQMTGRALSSVTSRENHKRMDRGRDQLDGREADG